MPTRAVTTASIPDTVIALGSNVGDKVANIARAIALLTEEGDIRLLARSRDYRTAPWGKLDQDWFVNACILVATDLPVREVLARCQAVERAMGRVRGEKWGPRLIDLDILVHGSTAMETADLVLPHPHITDRAFVLVPLADIAPRLLLKGRSVSDWLTRVPHDDVVPVGG